MKRLKEFEYHEPSTLDEAAALLEAAGEGGRILAGGTDLVVDMKTGRMQPDTVVNIKGIPGLEGVEEVAGGIRIGALTRVTAVQAAPLVRDSVPALADAASILAPPPVRHLATIGGNVGRASPASDLGPPLIAHQALASIHGTAGVREEPVESLYTGPGTTTLAHTDIITSFFIPDASPGFGSAHLKIGARATGHDIAMVGVTTAITILSGEITAARVVLASVAPTPLRASGAEVILVGAGASDETFAAAGAAAVAECAPIDDLRSSAVHRSALVEVLTVRALRRAAERAGEAA